MTSHWSRRAILHAAATLAGGGSGLWLAGCSGSSPASSPATSPLAASTSLLDGGPTPSPETAPAAVTTVASTDVPASFAPGVEYPRANRPATLPDNGLVPVDESAAVEAGPRRIVIYPDYIGPDGVAAFEAAVGTTVEITTFDEVAEAEATLRDGASTFDLVIGLPSVVITGLVVAAAVQPLNPALIPNAGNVLGGLQSPYYDVGAQYSMPYSVYTTGISYRRDQVSESLFNRDDAWPLLWDPQYAGKVGILPDVRDGLALGLLVNGVTDLNVEDPASVDAAAAVLETLVATMRPVFDIYSYENIPTGVTQMQQAWSGDMGTARNFLQPGQSTEILGYWHPTRAPISNDLMMIPARAANRILAHQFIDFMLDPANARANFDYVGYQPAVTNPSAYDLTSSGAVAEHLLATLVYDADVTIGYRIDPVAPVVQSLWETAWLRVNPGG